MPTEHDLAYSIFQSPIVLVPITMLGIGIAARWRRTGWTLAVVSVAALYLLSTPLVADYLIGRLQPTTRQSYDENARAIVVLSGDIEHTGKRPDQIRLGPLSLERVFWAAEQYRAYPLPILVSGGTIKGTSVSLADLLATALEKTFKIPVKWKETESRTTYENAELSSEILQNEKISNVIVVTQRWHMPRAIWAFAQFGVHAVPSDFASPSAPANFEVGGLIANARSLAMSTYALHEIIGLRYYKYFKRRPAS